MRHSRSVFSSIVVATVAVFLLSAHSARSDEDDDDPKAGPPKSQPKPKPKAPETKPETRVDTKAEPKAKPPETKAEPKATRDPFAKPAAKAEPEAKPEPTAKTSPKTHSRDLEDPFGPSHSRAETPKTSKVDPFARPPHNDTPTAKTPAVTTINRSPDGESLPAGIGAGRPVRVRLVDGSTVVGKVRAEREETLIVDCALGQLMIPRSRISTIGYDDSAKPGRNDMLGDVFH